jgi:hypothetical protein
MSKKYRFETIEEFIARGGKVTKLPEQIRVNKVETLHSTSKGPVIILSYDEADLLYGDKEKAAKKIANKKKNINYAVPKIDINALPENIRKRILAKLKENINDGEEEAQDVEDSDTEEV